MKKLTAIVSFAILTMLLLSACASNSFESIPSDVKKGDIVTFGNYEQDDETANGKEAIEWIVLDVKDGKALLLSKYALDYQPYNAFQQFNREETDVTWETSSIRKWLNDDFYNTAFSQNQKTRIASTALNDDTTMYNLVPRGNNTVDKVFLLSLKDISNPDYGFLEAFNTADTA